jgi:hypothetical protein
VIDDESLVKTRTNTCLSETSAVPSYSVSVFLCNCIINRSLDALPCLLVRVGISLR